MALVLGCGFSCFLGLGCFLFAVWLWYRRFFFTTMLVLLVVCVNDVRLCWLCNDGVAVASFKIIY